MDIIKVENISKIYPNGTKALDNISFNVRKGEIVMLLGHNGSGKSTMFRCMTNFEQPTAGSMIINGENITGLSKRKLRPLRRKVGMVFQNFNLIHNLSVFQNVLFGALGTSKTTWHTLAPFASKQLREEAMNCLDRVGLAHLATRRADQLSGGQKQRVAIARMLMQDPEIILADEPIASLDPKAGKEVMDLLLEIVKERNLTVVCILHQLEIARTYGERIIALKQGKLVIDKPVEEVNPILLEKLYEEEKLENIDVSLNKKQRGA